jgi:predicted peptidase
MQYILEDPPMLEKGQTYPLIVFLHGAGERGEEINLVTVHGPMKYAKKGGKIDAFILSPQCPKGVYWDTETLYHLILDILKNEAIDKSRVYLTGLSMGGWGTWKLSMEHPELFAAIAPVCGPVDFAFRHSAVNLKGMPIWIFHGAKDNVVPLEHSKRMMEYLKYQGITPKITVYPEANHDSWTATYDNPAVYEWLFEHKR